MLKYEKIFYNSNDKIDFMKRLIKRGIKKNTAHKAFERLNKKLKQIKIENRKVKSRKVKSRIKCQRPNSANMMQIWQLKETGIDVTEDYLMRNLYLSKEEIVWLKQKGEIK